ncbi:MAG: hypothetical protein HKL84_04625 [Acidimicrobiaceae bacterium]|nr:hypothetical protein [Acidimicrobiaceae bacterium]
MGSWRIIGEVGLASEMHSDPMRFAGLRTARFIDVTRSALVLGSNQNFGDVDLQALNRLSAELVVRKSGGGAVFLSPGGQLWVDIAIPKDDQLYDEDVSKSFHVIGEIFFGVLSDFGVHNLVIHTGRLVGGQLSKKICFAGLGPGEITCEGAKVVGMSQRRTSLGAVFQCTVYVRYPFKELQELIREVNATSLLRGYAMGVAEIIDAFQHKEDSLVVSELRRSLTAALENLR